MSSTELSGPRAQKRTLENQQTEPVGRLHKIHDDRNETADFLLAEYAALRAEMQERSKAQSQLIYLAIIASGTFMALGFQADATVALAYPVMGLFLLLLWVRHHHRIRQLGSYIKDAIETKFLKSGGWEHRAHPTGRSSVTVQASGGAIIGTQALTVMVGVFETSFDVRDTFLLALDAVVLVVSLVVLARQTR